MAQQNFEINFIITTAEIASKGGRQTIKSVLLNTKKTNPRRETLFEITDVIFNDGDKDKNQEVIRISGNGFPDNFPKNYNLESGVKAEVESFLK